MGLSSETSSQSGFRRQVNPLGGAPIVAKSQALRCRAH